MDNKIKIEQNFLRNTEEIIEGLLLKHYSKNDYQLDAFTKAKINALVTRIFNQEVEYLHEDPTNYFELYGEDHLKN